MEVAKYNLTMNHATDISKVECHKRFSAAFDAVLDNERLSIHVRAHVMEALSEIQRGMMVWRMDARRVRGEFIRLKEFILKTVPEASLPMIYERVEAVGDACRELLGNLDDVEDHQGQMDRWKLDFKGAA